MDKIVLKNMKFYGYHGLLAEEQVNGQDFLIDIELFMDLKTAGCSDNISDTVDYVEVYNIAKHVTRSNSFRLIEALAEDISREILSRYDRITGVTVCVKKPDAPLTGEFDWVGVEIKRMRNDV